MQNYNYNGNNYNPQNYYNNQNYQRYYYNQQPQRRFQQVYKQQKLGMTYNGVYYNYSALQKMKKKGWLGLSVLMGGLLLAMLFLYLGHLGIGIIFFIIAMIFPMIDFPATIKRNRILTAYRKYYPNTKKSLADVGINKIETKMGLSPKAEKAVNLIICILFFYLASKFDDTSIIISSISAGIGALFFIAFC